MRVVLVVMLGLASACSDRAPRPAAEHSARSNAPPVRGRLIGFGDTGGFIFLADSPAVRPPLSEPLVRVDDSTAVRRADGRQGSRVDLGYGNGIAVVIWPRSPVTDTTAVIDARRIEIVEASKGGRISRRGQSNDR